MDAQRNLPSREIELDTKYATYYHFKTDIFKGQITYSTDRNMASNLVTISAERAKEIIGMNKSGKKPDDLDVELVEKKKSVDYENVVGQDSLTRFDTEKKSGKSSRRKQQKPKLTSNEKPKPIINTKKNESN